MTEATVKSTLLNPTSRDVQWLLDQPRGEGVVVTCYADMSVSGGVRSLWREVLDNEVKQVETSLPDDGAVRAAFERNLAAIGTALSSRHATVARGMAVFAAVQRNFIQTFALTTPVPNRLVVNEEPYVMPLLEILSRQRRYLVVHTDTHRGRLYTWVPGAATLIQELDEEVPRRQRSSGQLWGKEQATIERHRRDHVAHYFKELVRAIERAWPEERYDGIVLLGAHEVLAAVREHLPAYLANHVAGEAPRAWVGRQASLDETIARIQEDDLRSYQTRVVDDIRRRLLEDHQIATGPQAVLDAIRNSQVGFPGSVVMEPDRGDVAWSCTGCGSPFAVVHERCPFCSSPCEKSNLWQAIALVASRHAIPVHVIGAGLGLERYGGVVALLAREEPWLAPPGTGLAAAV